MNITSRVYYKNRQGISWLAEWLLASQEGLCFMELDINILKHSIYHTLPLYLHTDGNCVTVKNKSLH